MSQSTRRTFLKTTALAGASYWVAGTAAAEDGQKPRSAIETINFASIGIGGKGESDSDDAGRNGNMVAICDVDQERLDKAGRKWPKAVKYTDYRKMLDEMGKTIDAVTVSTPDHNHAPASIRAMKQGIHCFTQKPLTHSLEEARLMGTVAREMKVATQMGNQGTANSALREVAAMVRAGALGKVSHVHIWTNRPVWPQGDGAPTDTSDPPAHLDWESWIGPAEMVPYSPAYHPFKWRGFWAFGTGALGDMACHTLNVAFAALDLRDPLWVQAETSGHNKVTFPKWSQIEYEFGPRGDRAGLRMTWYDGGKRPDQALLHGANMDSSGALIVGEKGSIYCPGDYAQSYQLLNGAEKKEVEYVRSPGHFEEWVKAIKGGEPAMSNFPDYASPLTETVLLGNLAVWASGKKVNWNAEKLEADDPDVAWIIRHNYRMGWELGG